MLQAIGFPKSRKPFIFLVLFSWMVFLSVFSCKRTNLKESQAGLESTAQGIRLVATYDPRFDAIFPKYRLLSVTFVNQSPQVIELNHAEDRWEVTLRNGQKKVAINNLRFYDQKAWNGLPLRAQEVIEYPPIILRNTTLTFDIVFPKEVDLTGFQRVDFYSAYLKKAFVGGSTYGEVQ